MTVTVNPTPRAICKIHSRYQKGCTDCRSRNAEFARTRYRLIAYGHWQPRTVVDAGEVRAHLSRLQESGLSCRVIAAKSNVAPTVVSRIAAGRQPRAYASTAAALLAVDPAPAPDTKVSSLGTARRLQALMAIGWDAHSLAERLDVHYQQVRKWRYRYRDRIPYRHHAAIAALYRELECRPGPAEKARAQARVQGYMPPVCWDDDGDIDDPVGRPRGLRKTTTHERRAA
ncbi:hypothetical protein GCM10010172_35350 [Paractinoplanes ferrugineus]|uniref:Uncharacterized protein n=1 Tax=Paractinoplanes ferrugineus TaxID=113564 RepID=A0A919MLE9_9ACTN|nr:hypothetical protein [Actinoplanes ferrugineus]GIE16755.1 hypothetical protein Afe05nite_85950 [Actinoplanes ferrugineus]